MTRPNPYIGPKAFQLKDRDLFHGRDQEVQKLLNLLIGERIVLLHSSSGAGKTSLINAALRPELEEEGFAVLPVMRVSRLLPPKILKDIKVANRYVFSCILSLEQFQEEGSEDRELSREEFDQLKELASMTFIDYLQKLTKLKKPARQFVLIFDQFEEILSTDPTDYPAKAKFFQQVGDALYDDAYWALFAMREDYVASLGSLVRPVPDRFSTRFKLDLLKTKKAREAIEKPAQKAKVFYHPNAVDKLINDLRTVKVQSFDGITKDEQGDFVEPMQLQVVCYRLWQKLKFPLKEDKQVEITTNDLEGTHVDNALAEFYKDCIEEVTAIQGAGDEASLRQWIEDKLITPGRTRGPVFMGPQDAAGVPKQVVEQLAKRHLLRGEYRAGARWYELTHDRFIEPIIESNRLYKAQWSYRKVKGLAVSLSGGGHRATLFVLGALMYLVDAKANADVTSISSVSGGSLTNGLVGQAVHFRETNGEEFRQRVARPLATQIALMGTLFAPLLSKIYITSLSLVGVVVLLVSLDLWGGPWYLRPLTLLIGIAVWGWLFGLRGKVCAFAFSKTLFSPGGRETTLAQLRKNNLDHVICATELRSAEQVYFAGDFIYSYTLGLGKPADMSLASAVQASAAYPGGFPPAILPAKNHEFIGAPSIPDGPSMPPAYMVLTDGGVYDNMGEQWARGFATRVNYCKELGQGRMVPTQLVVVNASSRVPWSPFRRRLIPLLGEAPALLRVLDVLFMNTTNVHRQVMAASYNPADPSTASALPSVLVQIAQSPYRVANLFAPATGPVGQRAKAVLEFLSKGPTRDEWARIASDNSAVATTLSKMGTEVSARLIYHGYVVTMCNLHVLFGDDFPLRPEELSIERFRKLIS